MASVVLAPTAVSDLDALIATHDLPATTRDRLRASLEPLAGFPRLGPALTGGWLGFRFILGPWSWMLVVYVYDEESDRVSVVTIQDARRGRSARSGR